MIQPERENSVFLNMVGGLIPVRCFPFGSMVKEFIFLCCDLLKTIIFCVLFDGNIDV